MHFKRTAVMVCIVLTGISSVFAENLQTEIDDRPGPITDVELALLSARTYAVRNYRDNAFLREEAERQARSYAESLPGADVVLQVQVIQVTKTEVLVYAAAAGSTRIAFVPSEDAREPDSFHSRHRNYAGPPSTLRYNLVTKPKTLRIDKAIPLDVAKQLRKGDIIPVIGKVDTVNTKVPAEFIDDNVVYIADVRFYEQE